MIQTIEVNKVVTADMDGDAIGGAVNLVTKNSPYRQTLSANAGAGYNPISQRVTFNGSVSWGSRFFKDRLGVMAAVAYHNNPIGSDNIEATWKEDDNGNAYVDEFEVRQYYVHRERRVIRFRSTGSSTKTTRSNCAACTTAVTTGRTATA